MKYCVYLLITNHKKKIFTYVGYTNNMKKRLILHNKSSGAKYTKGKKWIIFHKEFYSDLNLSAPWMVVGHLKGMVTL